MRDPFRSDLRIARVKARLLVMHGARDATIPIVFGERLFALAGEPKPPLTRRSDTVLLAPPGTGEARVLLRPLAATR